MMGHINNLVVRMVRESLGDEAVSRLFDEAGIGERGYQPEVIYPEGEFQALFSGAQKVFGVGVAEAEDAFSRFFMKVSPEMFPAIFKVAGSARGLFEKIPSIHQCFPAAASCSDYREKVHIVESTEERLVFEYDSPNRLCRTLRAVAGHVLEFYNEKGRVYETACAKDGAARCRVVVEFDG